MNARQDKYPTHVDRKNLDDILHVHDKVCVNFPRMKRMKLVPNWFGPFRIIFADHPVYCIEVKTQNRTFTKVVTRGRIKRAKSDAIINNFNENILIETKNTENDIENVGCTESRSLPKIVQKNLLVYDFSYSSSTLAWNSLCLSFVLNCFIFLVASSVYSIEMNFYTIPILSIKFSIPFEILAFSIMSCVILILPFCRCWL